MSAHESVLGFQWLYSTLSGDATLLGYAVGGIWRSLAPPEQATPFVIISHQSGSDVTNAFGVRIITEQLFQVKAVGPASNMAPIASAAEQLDTLLGGTTSGPASGFITVSSVNIGKVLACWRQTQIAVDELVNGEVWTNLGGLYRMQIEQVT